MSASSVSSSKTPPDDSPDTSSSSSSSNSSQESLLAKLSLPIPNPFFSANHLNFYLPQEVLGSAERSPVYKGLFYPYGLSRSGLQLTISVVMRAANLEAIPSFVTQINKNRLVIDSFIVGVKDEVVVDGRLWVVFPYLGPSLRELFPNGVESSQILTAVRSLFITVGTLCSIHSAKLIHGQVNPGHIYKKQDFPAYQIGFGATIYESGQEKELEKGFKRALKICEWASAPEVWFNGNNMAYHTRASDIWQVGMTALELALGELIVRNREDLDELIAAAKTSSWTHGLFGSVGFKSFLQVCLEQNPNMRPTSRMLLQHNFFRANNFGLAPGPGPGLN